MEGMSFVSSRHPIPPLIPSPLGLHQGRQLSRAGAASREPQLASMAPAKPDGRRRQCQVKAGVQETEQVDG